MLNTLRGQRLEEAFAKNIEMGEFSSMSDQESKEIYKNMHKATKEAMVGAGMGTEKAHEHTSKYRIRNCRAPYSKICRKRRSSQRWHTRRSRHGSCFCSKDTVSVVTAVNGSTDEPTEADLSAIRSIGAHAAADIVAHDAASNDNNADLVQAAAMKAAQGAGLHEGHSNSIAVKKASEATLNNRAIAKCNDVAYQANKAGLEAYQVGLISVSAARQAGLSEIEAQTVGSDAAKVAVQKYGQEVGKEADQLATEKREQAGGDFKQLHLRCRSFSML